MKSSEGQRRRLFLLELAQGLIVRVPDTNVAGADTFGNEDGITAPGQPPQAQQAVGVVKRRICCLCSRQVD